MERDVVCGMQVDPVKAAGTSEVGGKTCYFCSKGCKAKFDADPPRYGVSPSSSRLPHQQTDTSGGYTCPSRQRRSCSAGCDTGSLVRRFARTD